MKSRRTPHIEAILVGGAVALSIIVHGIFIIRGFGEPDAARLVVAAQEWHLAGRTLYQSYIFRTSPLFIHGVKKVLDAGLPPAALPAALNWMAVVLGALSMVPLYLLWRRLAGRSAAAITGAFFFFTPSWWLANSYGMAHLPAFGFFVLALTLFAYGLDVKGRSQTLMFVGAAVAAAAGADFKADMILCYGAFLGVALSAGHANRRIVSWSLAIPAVALIDVMAYTQWIAPSLGAPMGFAGEWSSNFPFTAEALADPVNRNVMLGSAGGVLGVLSVLAAVHSLILKRHGRHLILVALWALPPLMFWGLRLGNSARHMMAVVAVLMFLLAVVLVSYIRNSRLRLAVVTAVLVLNYALGAGVGDAIAPTSRLHTVHKGIQRYVDNLHRGATSFATFPVPSKLYVGGPGGPYALYEVMARSLELDSYEGDPPTGPGIDLVEKWPRYVAQYGEGNVHVVSIAHVMPPYKMPPVEGWFGFTTEPGISTTNRMARWRPFINEAVRENPESVRTWATSGALKIEAGMALTDGGFLEEALRMFEEGLEARPDLPDALWNTAMLHGHFKRFDESRALLERFITQHPGDPRVAMARELLETPEPSEPQN